MKYKILSIKNNLAIKGIKVLCLFTLTTYYLLLTTSEAYGAEFSLGISPQIIRISAIQGQTINTAFDLENFSNEAITLNVQYKEFTVSKTNNNLIEFIANSKSMTDLSAQSRILLDGQKVERFTLQPRKKEKFYLNILIPEGLPSRDYTFTLLFSEIPSTAITDEMNSYSLISGGIGINVLLSIGKNENESLEITEFSTPILISSGPVYFTIKAENKGSHLINPQGTLKIYNSFGQLVGKIELARLNILAKNSRSYFDPTLSEEVLLNTSKDIKKDQIIVWQESILIGLYKAELNFTLENGENISQTIHFLALPYNTLFILLLILIVILYIKKRFYHYLNK